MKKRLFNNTIPGSLSNKFRRKRFVIFREILDSLSQPVKILDLGGTENFWLQMGITESDPYRICILNTEKITTTLKNINYMRGSAADFAEYNIDFDVIFSNSLIEHLGSHGLRKKMADSIISEGKPYFIQTPNYYFPVEPHFLFPCFQYMPRKLKVSLVSNFDMGWYKKTKDKTTAGEIIDSVYLLNKNEVAELFPGAEIILEKFLGLNKSVIALKR